MCVQHSFLIHILLEMKCCLFQGGGSEGRGARANPQAGDLRYFLSLLHPTCWLSSSLRAIGQAGPSTVPRRGSILIHSQKGPSFQSPKAAHPSLAQRSFTFKEQRSRGLLTPVLVWEDGHLTGCYKGKQTRGHSPLSKLLSCQILSLICREFPFLQASLEQMP